MLVLPHNCQGSARFQIEDDKANASLIKRFQNGLQEPDDTLNPDYIGKPLNPEPLAQPDHRHYTYEKYSLSLLKYRFGIMPRVAPGRALNP